MVKSEIKGKNPCFKRKSQNRGKRMILHQQLSTKFKLGYFFPVLLSSHHYPPGGALPSQGTSYVVLAYLTANALCSAVGTQTICFQKNDLSIKIHQKVNKIKEGATLKWIKVCKYIWL